MSYETTFEKANHLFRSKPTEECFMVFSHKLHWLSTIECAKK